MVTTLPFPQLRDSFVLKLIMSNYVCSKCLNVEHRYEPCPIVWHLHECNYCHDTVKLCHLCWRDPDYDKFGNFICNYCAEADVTSMYENCDSCHQLRATKNCTICCNQLCEDCLDDLNPSEEQQDQVCNICTIGKFE